MNIREQAAILKQDSIQMAVLPLEKRNQALHAVAKALTEKKEEILSANRKDLSIAEENQIAMPILKRLKFDEAKLQGVIDGIEELIKLPDPLFKLQLSRELDEGLELYRETCPIGVIGVIFESRPDALVQIATLCLKSGNCAILKGGSEAMYTNRALFETIHQAVVANGLPEGCMAQAELRSEINELLECDQYVDLLIPRGSNEFVRYIMDHTKIPVMGHADGICHIYVDETFDLETAIPVIVDSKTQYVAVCNAVETLLVNRKAANELLPALAKALREKNVEIRGTKEVREIIECATADEEDFKTEYLDYIISVKLVDSMEAAVSHINQYGSHHTDCIVTQDMERAKRFMQLVDSAGVYCNCSTRFADGFKYGFGAEVGVSTGKLHARGPVGLEGLVTYKYKLFGKGHIVDDYATGKKQFHFKPLS
ncbi:MAG: glutamate-5-semialdehyde dehydrogenase [Clostridia bacterium]|nr:glutamate-5-semialdehyde dehydrogenase [Clostridia bacterium]